MTDTPIISPTYELLGEPPSERKPEYYNNVSDPDS